MRDVGMTTVGEKIRALRKAHGLTMVELAMQTECSQSYISQLERGLSGYTSEMIDRIARVFSVSPGLLQSPDVEVEQLTDISEILSALSRLPPSKVQAVRQMILALDE